MTGKDDEIQDLYVAAYTDTDAAEEDWAGLKRLAADDAIKVHALALVNRDTDGKIHVKDTRNEPGIGAVIGAVGGALVGLIFPPSLIASAAVGAGIGAGSGTIIDRVTKHKVESEVEWNVPPGGSGIAVVFDEEGASAVDRALSRADRVARRHLHESDGEEVADSRFD
ncbi:MAG TPA: DUF1269 domain-containing protein [Microlunatus sp.]|nr:DUF1269 domain-containing protein [Microlunatus sp.]